MSNIEKMIQIIENNRSLMDAQVVKLSCMAPALDISTLEDVKDSTSLLNAVITGNMHGAANALKAMAEVQADFCNNFAQQNNASRFIESQNIIDVEAKHIEEG